MNKSIYLNDLDASTTITIGEDPAYRLNGNGVVDFLSIPRGDQPRLVYFQIVGQPTFRNKTAGAPPGYVSLRLPVPSDTFHPTSANSSVIGFAFFGTSWDAVWIGTY